VVPAVECGGVRVWQETGLGRCEDVFTFNLIQKKINKFGT
jgi:hypothetical protein